MEELKQQNVGLYLHQQNVDSSTAAGKAMLSMCGVFAEFERSIIIERVNAGLARPAHRVRPWADPNLTLRPRRAFWHSGLQATVSTKLQSWRESASAPCSGSLIPPSKRRRGVSWPP